MHHTLTDQVDRASACTDHPGRRKVWKQHRSVVPLLGTRTHTNTHGKLKVWAPNPKSGFLWVLEYGRFCFSSVYSVVFQVFTKNRNMKTTNQKASISYFPRRKGPSETECTLGTGRPVAAQLSCFFCLVFFGLLSLY